MLNKNCILKKVYYKLFIPFMISMFFLFSCSKKNLVENDRNSIADNRVNTLPKGVYHIRNPFTNNTMVFDENGHIIVKVCNGDLGDSVSIVEDKFTNEPLCICKNIYGEKEETNTDEYEIDGVKQVNTYSYPSSRMELYDLGGKLLPFSKPKITYIEFGRGNNIYYSEPYTNKCYAYNVKNNIETELDCDYTGTFAGKVFLSSNSYSDSPKILKIYDENLNFIKEIKGYTFDYEDEIDGKKCARVSTYSNITFDNKYNYIDENLNLLYKEPISLNTNYDKERDATYKEEEKVTAKLKDIDNSISYVMIKKHNDKKLYFADYNIYDDNTDNYSFGVKILDKDMNLIMDCASYIPKCFEKEGYIILDFDTLVDFDFNVIKKFDRKSEWQEFEKFGKVFYHDQFDDKYNGRENFSICNEKFEVVFPNVKMVNSSIDDKYLVITDNESTKFYDKDLKLIKELKMSCEIYNWDYINNKYKVFVNTDTNLYGIMDNEYNILLEKLKSVDDLKKDYFTYQNGFKYGLMDYEGNSLIEFSIFDRLTEDREIENNIVD